MGKLEIEKVVTENELKTQATLLAKEISNPFCITLSGDLGVGKSTFARAFIRALCKNPELFVPSPTFSLLHTYHAPSGFEIVHSDWYRLSSDEEIFELGIPFHKAVCLIEWPEKGRRYLPKNRFDIILQWVDEQQRIFKIV